MAWCNDQWSPCYIFGWWSPTDISLYELFSQGLQTFVEFPWEIEYPLEKPHIIYQNKSLKIPYPMELIWYQSEQPLKIYEIYRLDADMMLILTKWYIHFQSFDLDDFFLKWNIFKEKIIYVICLEKFTPGCYRNQKNHAVICGKTLKITYFKMMITSLPGLHFGQIIFLNWLFLRE